MSLDTIPAELFRVLEDDLIAETGNLYGILENAVSELQTALGLPDNYYNDNKDLTLPVDIDEAKRQLAIVMLHTSRLAYHLGHAIGTINRQFPRYVAYLQTLQAPTPTDSPVEFAGLKAFQEVLGMHFPKENPDGPNNTPSQPEASVATRARSRT